MESWTSSRGKKWYDVQHEKKFGNNNVKVFFTRHPEGENHWRADFSVNDEAAYVHRDHNTKEHRDILRHVGKTVERFHKKMGVQEWSFSYKHGDHKRAKLYHTFSKRMARKYGGGEVEHKPPPPPPPKKRSILSRLGLRRQA